MANFLKIILLQPRCAGNVQGCRPVFVLVDKKIILTLISGRLTTSKIYLDAGRLARPPADASGPVKTRVERAGVKSWCNLFKTTRARAAAAAGAGSGGTQRLHPPVMV